MSVLFKNLAALKAALKVEHDLVMHRLRSHVPKGDDYHYKFFRSRGMRVIAHAPNGQDNRGNSRFYDGQWEWDGTKTDLEKAVLEAIQDGYDRLYIDEGFDAAERMEDWENDSYGPNEDEFELCFWSKDGFDDGQQVVWGEFSTPLPQETR